MSPDVLSRTPQPSMSTRSIVYALLAVLTPWSVGTAHLDLFDATFVHAHGWIYRLTVGAGEPVNLRIVNDLTPNYLYGPTALGMELWLLGTATLAGTTVAIIGKSFAPESIPRILPRRFDTPTTTGVGLIIAGALYVSASIALMFALPGFTFFPLGAAIMLVLGGHLLKKHNVIRNHNHTGSETA